ncbi:MAG TPA: GIY-YIG nuclease family protein [Longimicrobiaceae bacterium]|nr:GIY-YIG nuclease family protein [Longimicrobiaceae bacterium]
MRNEPAGALPERRTMMDLPRRAYYVYMAASHSRTLYVGVTNDLARRMYEHRLKVNKGFTAKYNVNRLVWFEITGNVSGAIAREKQIKGYSRKKKIALIEETNAGWNDLMEEMGLWPREGFGEDAAASGSSVDVAAAPRPRDGRG